MKKLLCLLILLLGCIGAMAMANEKLPEEVDGDKTVQSHIDDNQEIHAQIDGMERSGRHFGYFLALGLAALGVALGQGVTAFSAITGIARNPTAATQLLTPMILAFAFMESLLIFVIISVYILK